MFNVWSPGLGIWRSTPGGLLAMLGSKHSRTINAGKQENHAMRRMEAGFQDNP